MAKWCLGFIVSLLIIGSAAAEFRPFAELWNNFAYYDTNLERKGFSSILGHYEGKIGFYLLDTPLQLYGAYYGITAQTGDYFDNSLFTGAGVRFKPFEGSFKGTSWLNEWIPDIKVFGESLSAGYLKGGSSAEAAGLAKTDTRYGFDLWHEWNLDKPNENLPWAELWSNLSYRDTNFGWESFKNYVFYFQPKIGRHLGRGIETYLKADAVYSGKGGPSYSFLNVADYGVGVRFEPWRNMATANELLRKFKMFFEVLSVSYLKEKPADPNKVVDRDVRFGIDFSYGRSY
ncbi:MAG: hypothetical protein PHG97_00735 [Candidatus Margulisbacteria bacterium]|nr:hypothetical protein [Candidatus Margulisiibacteriota bacterium]